MVNKVKHQIFIIHICKKVSFWMRNNSFLVNFHNSNNYLLIHNKERGRGRGYRNKQIHTHQQIDKWRI